MARCRIGYLLALVGSVAFFICFADYLSFYVLVLALCFPLFSLVLSLPGMLGTRVGFALSQSAMRRGSTVALTLSVVSRWKLPIGRVSARFRCVNLMTGDVLSFRKKGSGGSLGLELGDGVESKHCGLLRCEVTRLKVCDLLGIFSLRLAPPSPVSILVLPLEQLPESAPLLLGEGAQNLGMKPRPGGGPGDDYDLRPYRPGDPLRSVHWKLSSKVDGLIVRETLEPVTLTAVISFDLFGDPEELDRVFDRLDAVSRALIQRERPHSIQWAHPLTGEACLHTIASEKDLRACQWEIFSTSAPQTGRSILSAPPRAEPEMGVIRRLHLSAEEEPDTEGGGRA